MDKYNERYFEFWVYLDYRVKIYISQELTHNFNSLERKLLLLGPGELGRLIQSKLLSMTCQQYILYASRSECKHVSCNLVFFSFCNRFYYVSVEENWERGRKRTLVCVVWRHWILTETKNIKSLLQYSDGVVYQ